MLSKVKDYHLVHTVCPTHVMADKHCMDMPCVDRHF